MNPFAHRNGSQAIDVESRKAMVRRFTREQCPAALEIEGLQITVEAAIRRRLRELEK